MRAVRFYGVGDVRVEEIEKVKSTDKQALVKIIYGGICGSDLHIFREGMFVKNIPETMGHEFIGRVVKVPTGSDLNEGDIVIGDPRVPCGNCNACKSGEYNRCKDLGFIGEVSPGAFAEYLAIEPQKLIKIKHDVDTKRGALAEPLAVAVHACHNIVSSNPKRVLIAGAGPIGLLIAYLLKFQYGILKVAVTDIDEYRLKKAIQAGVDEVITSIENTNGEYDCIVDAVGLPNVLNTSLSAIAPGGCIYISAIYEKNPILDVNIIVGNELLIKGNNAYSFKDLEEAVEMINSGSYDFSWLISRIVHVDNAPNAFDLLTTREKKDLKILIDFQ
ncbi:MAG: alcohol dehydrogenase catalytic domain-containing protein [Sedimentibacter sp.]|uniref:zinc-dependent alcohol dehydrogenase n=1 Tax=Sedimentibacter sp. TaxID=1960295 RepID=UPI0031580237